MSKPSFIIWSSASVLIAMVAGCIYLNHGVVKNVLELDIALERTKKDQLSYVDRIYAYNQDFPKNNGKINVLIEGVSYGRDFANTLLESAWADSVNISYVFDWDKEYINRIQEADYVFTFKAKSQVPLYVWVNLNANSKIYGIGTKNFGASMGEVYSRRWSKDYYKTLIAPDERYMSLNDRWRTEWGEDNYVDFMKLAINETGMLRIFTPDNKYISWDCQHLTQAGAQWYASVIEWDKYLCIDKCIKVSSVRREMVAAPGTI